jgi:hypothetical protein
MIVVSADRRFILHKSATMTAYYNSVISRFSSEWFYFCWGIIAKTVC